MIQVDPSKENFLVRASMFSHRYNLIKSRLKRLKHDKEIVSVETVKNTQKYEKIYIIFGIILKGKDDVFCLEDSTGKMNLDFSGCDFIQGCYFIENCFYVVKGFLDTNSASLDSFKVTQLALPPIETNVNFRNSIGNKNLFGTNSKKCAAANQQLKSIEVKNPDIFFIFLNEFWLDCHKTMENFDKMIRGFITYSMTPAAIVITGNFTKNRFVNEMVTIENYCRLFTEFSKNVSEKFPELVSNTRIIFVPGSNDPGPMSNFLPRQGMYSTITSKISKYLPNAYFTSNPCRLQYCTQEIMVCKLDLNRLLETFTLEYSIHQNTRSNNEKINDLTQTVNSQSHLCPLPLDVQPILDQKDHILQMYNLPDLIVYGQGALNIKQFYKNGIASPGSFGEKGLFMVYYPAKKEMQESQISE